MKTRVGKIARLPYETREQLNLRLLNGEFGGPLLHWLNELPETKEILAMYFGGNPITKQNLSEWRHGGYQDWLFHQHRQERFQQMNEQGEELKCDEGSGNSFENFSRLVLAEMVENLNALHEITDRDKRWNRLREIGRDLARLQHSYSHCRKTELSRQKWEYETGADYPPGEEEPEAARNTPPTIVAPASCPSEPPGQDARATANQPNTVAPCPATSTQKNLPAEDRIRVIHHRQCSRGCVCKDCHPDNGKYPYPQALKDYEDSMKPEYWASDNLRPFTIMNVDCDCYCDCSIVARASCPCEPDGPDARATTY